MLAEAPLDFTMSLAAISFHTKPLGSRRRDPLPEVQSKIALKLAAVIGR